MDQRRPAGMSGGDWLEALIRHAQEHGQFDHIDQAPDPMAGVDLDRPDDEQGWLRSLMRREGLTIPSEIRITRQRVAEFQLELPQVRDEQAVREAVSALNTEIDRVTLTNTSPIASDLTPLGPEGVVGQWRQLRWHRQLV